MKTLSIIFILLFSINIHCQEIKITGYKDLYGICNSENIVARFSIFTYTPSSENKIKRVEKDLNSKIESLKLYPKLKEESIINIVINCEGKVLISEIKAKSIIPEIKFEIENAFKMLKIWSKRKYNGHTDSSILINFKIENGEIHLN